MKLNVMSVSCLYVRTVWDSKYKEQAYGHTHTTLATLMPR
jgi:hypothetical protein